MLPCQLSILTPRFEQSTGANVFGGLPPIERKYRPVSPQNIMFTYLFSSVVRNYSTFTAIVLLYDKVAKGYFCYKTLGFIFSVTHKLEMHRKHTAHFTTALRPILRPNVTRDDKHIHVRAFPSTIISGKQAHTFKALIFPGWGPNKSTRHYKESEKLRHPKIVINELHAAEFT